MEFAVTVICTAGPAASVDGTPVTVSQLAPEVTEIFCSVPPPLFCTPKGCDCGPGLAVSALNETRLLVTVSCGAGAVTVSNAAMLWLVPAQGLGAIQVTLTVV